MNKVLIVVDMQNDFITGSLAVPNVEDIIPIVNDIILKFSNDTIIFTRDWHPKFTTHFRRWPDHCVKDTWGAEFHKDLCYLDYDITVSKGTSITADGYSAFEGTIPIESTNVSLHNMIEDYDEVYICGLATDYCVKATALDAIKLGYNTFLIVDAIKGVKEDTSEDILEMSKAGVKLCTSKSL